jgi:acetate kinase
MERGMSVGDTGLSVLALNAGSSSLKFELFAREAGLPSRVRGAVRGIGRQDVRIEWEAHGQRSGRSIEAATHKQAIEVVLDELLDPISGADPSVSRIAVTAHRIVHGGRTFTAPVIVTSEVTRRLSELSHLAPLHNPPALAVLAAVRDRFPELPAAAVFDTAFFESLPEYASRYAVPRAWHEQYGIRRFGFHGIAHAYLRERLMHVAAGGRSERVVTVHLGQGCSVTALADGAPVDTSMGFTPLEGLIMGTRAGDIDAGAVLHVASRGESWDAIDQDLNRRSGLLGLSDASDDVRELLDLEEAGHEGAALALSAFCHRVRKYIGAYAAVLGGLDALVFGGGIGENAPQIRARVCESFGWLGLELDAAANARCIGAEGRISSAGSRVSAHVITVHEEKAIARAALRCLETDPAAGPA